MAEYRVSRLLSRLLRHSGMRVGLHFRSDGYVKVDDILCYNGIAKLNVTLDDIKHITDTNGKKRFALINEKGVYWIKANQGHSMQFDNIQYKTIKPGDISLAIHGTYYKAWELIKTKGLKTMGRTHVHFAIGEYKSGNVISGMRGNCQILIYLNIEKCLDNGIELLLSDNNVVLTTGISGVLPTCYFEKVLDANTGKELLEN